MTKGVTNLQRDQRRPTDCGGAAIGFACPRDGGGRNSLGNFHRLGKSGGRPCCCRERRVRRAHIGMRRVAATPNHRMMPPARAVVRQNCCSAQIIA